MERAMNRSSWRARPMSVPLTAAEWQRERDNRAAATPPPPETTAAVIGLPAEKKQSLVSADLQPGTGRLAEATGHFQAMGLLIGRYRGVGLRTLFAIGRQVGAFLVQGYLGRLDHVATGRFRKAGRCEQRRRDHSAGDNSEQTLRHGNPFEQWGAGSFGLRRSGPICPPPCRAPAHWTSWLSAAGESGERFTRRRCRRESHRPRPRPCGVGAGSPFPELFGSD